MHQPVGPLPGWIVSDQIKQVYQQPPRPPCRILPNPNEYTYCNKPSGEHTVLDYPVCDECWEAVRLP